MEHEIIIKSACDKPPADRRRIGRPRKRWCDLPINESQEKRTKKERTICINQRRRNKKNITLDIVFSFFMEGGIMKMKTRQN